MNDITELSKEFCEQNGICWHEPVNMTEVWLPMNCKASWICSKCGKRYTEDDQPDFTDARNVLDVVMKRKDAHEFIGSIATSLTVSPQGCEYQIPVELVRDLTGKLLKLAVEWRREHHA